jgi:hypothetical protein
MGSQRHYSNSRYSPTYTAPSVLGTDVVSPQFTAKSLNRQAKKAQKDENAEKARLKKVRWALLLSSNRKLSCADWTD